MELRWFNEVLRYRVLETWYTNVGVSGLKISEWTDWKDVPTVNEEKGND